MFGIGRLALYAANPVATATNTGFGYWQGGFQSSPLTRLSSVKKYTFPTDGISTATALSGNRDQVCGLSDTVYGHAFGGAVGSGGGSATTIHERYTLSTESKTTGTALATAQRDVHSGVSTSTYGYILGRYTTTYSNTIIKYQHSNDTYASFTNTLWSGTVWTSVSAHNNSTLAIAVGGYNGSTANTNYARFTFSTETAATAQTLPAAQGQVSMCGDQLRAFIFTGFTSPTSTMTTAVRNYTFATDTWASSTSLSYTIRWGDGAGNDVVGAIGGGTTGTGTSSMSTSHTKITYATDTFATAGQIYSVSTDSPGAFSSVQIQ